MTAAQCAFIGDDTPDVPLLRAVGLAFAVADAHPTARRAAHHVTRLAGGCGAVREVCDRLLAARIRAQGSGTLIYRLLILLGLVLVAVAVWLTLAPRRSRRLGRGAVKRPGAA